MFLLNDLKLPTKLEHIDYNYELKNTLLKLTNLNNITSFLLYGPESCGKKTFIRCFLNNFYKDNIISTNKLFTLSNTHLIAYSSNKYYYELYPSDYFQDNIIFLKEFIEHIKYSLYHNIIVIYNIHKFISNNDLFILKNIIEKYHYKITLIITNNKPLNLFCNIRARSLTIFELNKLCLYINHNANLNISFDTLLDICHKAKRNLNNLYILLQNNTFNQYYNINNISYILLQNNITQFIEIKNIIKQIIIKDLYTIEQIFSEIIYNIIKKTKILPHIITSIAAELLVNSLEQKYKHIYIEIFIMNIYKLMN